MTINYEEINRAAIKINDSFRSSLICEIKQYPNREFTEHDSLVMSKEEYESLTKMVAKKESDKQSQKRYNSLVGRLRKKR